MTPVRWYLIATTFFVADQITKLLAVEFLSYGAISILPVASLQLACNSGAAFSILQDMSFFLGLISVAFSIYFAYAIYRLPAGQKLQGLAFALILAGASGNAVDRLARGCVIDFIHLHYEAWSFPIFNVADTAITFGAAFWVVVIYLDMRNSKSNNI